jgi:hypothetical protein
MARCAAVLVGSLIALASLLRHVPVWVASLRGVLSFLAVLAALQIGLTALERALAGDAKKRDESTGGQP